MKATAIRSLFMENNPAHAEKKTGQSHLKSKTPEGSNVNSPGQRPGLKK